MSVRKISTCAALVTMMALAGCSSTGEADKSVAISRFLVGMVKKDPAAPTPQQVAAVASEALARTAGPLAIVIFKSRKAATVIRQIESNGDYRTWSTWGVKERRTVTTKHGVITATRGLGFDLMSSDIDALLALVQRRQEGTVSYVMRFLDGNHTIKEETATCEIKRGDEQFVEIGEIRQPALQMFASCVSPERQFVNLYIVNGAGRVLQTRQWTGPSLGFASLQYLR